jgi:hypothetical protein
MAPRVAADEDPAFCACCASYQAKNPKISRSDSVCHAGAINGRRVGANAAVVESAGIGPQQINSDRRRCARSAARHLIQVTREMHGQEPIAALAPVPLRRRQSNVAESLRPLIFDSKSHGIREVFLEKLGSLFEAFDVILFHATEKLAKP